MSLNAMAQSYTTSGWTWMISKCNMLFFHKQAQEHYLGILHESKSPLTRTLADQTNQIARSSKDDIASDSRQKCS